MKLERTDGSVRMSRLKPSVLSEVRIILEKKDVEDDFSAVLGGYLVKASFRKADSMRRILMNEGDWPLELSFGGRAENPVSVRRSIRESVTERKAVNKSADSRGKLVYIFIEPVKEGIHAGK